MRLCKIFNGSWEIARRVFCQTKLTKLSKRATIGSNRSSVDHNPKMGCRNTTVPIRHYLITYPQGFIIPKPKTVILLTRSTLYLPIFINMHIQLDILKDMISREEARQITFCSENYWIKGMLS